MSNLDFDVRDKFGGMDTSDAARNATGDRPRADEDGLITYPNYQVAVARRGDTVQDVADRIGVEAGELASFNGLQPTDRLNRGALLTLPGGTNTASGGIDVTTIATTAIDNAPAAPAGGIIRTTPSRPLDGPQPIQHQVARGETVYTIAKLYNVSVRSLADWNGLGPDLAIRQGQYLLIPVTLTAEMAAEAVTSAPVKTAAPAKPTARVAKTKFHPPVTGKTLRPYKKNSNEGIDIAASAGTRVKAAEAGEIAAITRNTDQEAIMVIRHANNLLTVYANIEGITVKKGERVSRGQTIAKVAKGDPSFLHFEVRDGFDSVNPAGFIK